MRSRPSWLPERRHEATSDRWNLAPDVARISLQIRERLANAPVHVADCSRERFTPATPTRIVQLEAWSSTERVADDRLWKRRRAPHDRRRAGRDGSAPTSTQRTPADTAGIRWVSLRRGCVKKQSGLDTLDGAGPAADEVAAREHAGCRAALARHACLPLRPR